MFKEIVEVADTKMNEETKMMFFEEIRKNTMQDENLFFDAWKRGVKLIGEELFYPGTPETAESIWDLKPNCKLIEECFDQLSRSERAFLANLVSFYDDETGAMLAKKVGYPASFNGLTMTLTYDYRQVLIDLMNNYTGW